MTFEEFEKTAEALGQKIGFTNKNAFIAVHKLLSEGEGIKAVSDCGNGAIIVTERNFYSYCKTGFIAADNTVIPLDKITSFSSSGILQMNLTINEGTIVHQYSSTIHTDKILAAIREVKSAPKPLEAASVPAQQDTAAEIRKYKALLDDGVITQEDFDKKKAQLLGL
jgi:hypothetical protein